MKQSRTGKVYIDNKDFLREAKTGHRTNDPYIFIDQHPDYEYIRRSVMRFEKLERLLREQKPEAIPGVI